MANKQEPARMSRRITSLLHGAGYRINATVPDDHRAFYSFKLNDQGELDKASLTELGVMHRDLYYHIIQNAPSPGFAVKEMLHHFGIEFAAHIDVGSAMGGVELSPAYASSLREKGVDVEKLGQGQGIPMQGVPLQQLDDDTPSTPGLDEVLERRTEAVAQSALRGEMPAVAPALEPQGPQLPTLTPQPPPPAVTEPPPPTAPSPPTDRAGEIPQGEVRHVGTISREEMVSRKNPSVGPVHPDFDPNEI